MTARRVNMMTRRVNKLKQSYSLPSRLVSSEVAFYELLYELVYELVYELNFSLLAANLLSRYSASLPARGESWRRVNILMTRRSRLALPLGSARARLSAKTFDEFRPKLLTSFGQNFEFSSRLVLISLSSLAARLSARGLVSDESTHDATS